MSHKYIFAVDPGEGGGIAFTNGIENFALALSDRKEVVQFIKHWASPLPASIICYVEEVGGYIGKEQPGSRMFVFGESFGYAQGLFDMAEVPIIMVRPQRWLKAVAPGTRKMDYGKRKQALRALSQHWYPELKVTLATADALAILRYAIKAENGEYSLSGEAPMRAGGWRQDAKQAVKWAKAAGWPVAKRGTKGFVAMVNYWVREVKGQ